MKKITVQVTQNEIKRGLKKSALHCPVALAMGKLGFHMTEVVVNADPERFKLKLPNWKEGECLYIPLPYKVCERIWRFDMTGEMEPFEFEIEIPE